MDVMDGTGAALLVFLERAGARGDLNESTAQSLAVSVRRILRHDADPEGVDLRQLDVDDLLERFQTKNRLEFSTHSLQTYKSRFRRAHEMYMAFLDGRTDWKKVSRPSSPGGPPGGATPRRPPAKKRAGSGALAATATMQAEGHKLSESGPAPGLPAMVPYDLPLRQGLFRARLVLPENLTHADADRIAAFVKSLAFDHEPPPQPAWEGADKQNDEAPGRSTAPAPPAETGTP